MGKVSKADTSVGKNSLKKKLIKFSINTKEQILKRYHPYKYKGNKNVNTEITSWNTPQHNT